MKRLRISILIRSEKSGWRKLDRACKRAKEDSLDRAVRKGRAPKGWWQRRRNNPFKLGS